MKQYILLLALCINRDFSSAEEIQNPLQPRINGVRNARQNEFPFVVGLLLNRSIMECSGSIINQHKVLTAAHCIKGTTYNQWLVTAGSYYWGDTNVIQRKVSSLKMHPQYKSTGDSAFDIGIMDVAQPFEFNAAVHPVVLPRFNERLRPGTRAVAIGWGLTQTRTKMVLPLMLQALEVVPVVNGRCTRVWTTFERSICVVNANILDDTCFGDSGGPMMVGNVQWGLTSSGTANCKAGDPMKFLDVSRFTEWINRFSTIRRRNN
ncbi:chymotrypsin-1-like isoform X1 [Periplaneta americana]|uniref:chymotrypsin-1-like isoform X1 n=1 Tax=Periplaneta americana TaxID=6978 RepID=UPI0037E7FFF1